MLTGTSYADTLTGQGGNDKLYGKAGNDTLVGGDLDDFFRGNAGADSIDGGAGTGDFAEFRFGPAGVGVNVSTTETSRGRYWWGTVDTRRKRDVTLLPLKVDHGNPHGCPVQHRAQNFFGRDVPPGRHGDSA